MGTPAVTESVVWVLQIPDMKKYLRHLPDQARERTERDYKRYLEVQDKYEKMVPFEQTVMVSNERCWLGQTILVIKEV